MNDGRDSVHIDAASGMRTFEGQRRYLNLPVRNGAAMRQMSVSIAGEIEYGFDIELADGEPDWWAFIDVQNFHGKTLTVALDDAGPSAPLDGVHLSDRIVDEETLYRETRRPQLRFSSRRGWLNDANGMVFFDGEYHLFYQHNPYGVAWGNMHWGHAVSSDLVHWEELPIALYPDDSGPVYSGSVVVDWNDTAGLQRGSDPSLIAIYTAFGDLPTQCIASSADRGRTWQKFEGNPALPAMASAPSSRDPKVFWYAPDNKWVMVLYLDQVHPDEDRQLVAFYLGQLDPATYTGLTMDDLRLRWRENSFGFFSSSNLKEWTKMSEIALPEDAECPEFFELPIEDSSGDSRWILFGASGRYLIGSFDGETFAAESGPHFLHSGDSFSAAQTFNSVPSSDGRRILIAYAPTTKREEPVFAGMPFNQSMGLPVELTLHATDDGLRLHVNPVSELCGLRLRTQRVAAGALSGRTDPLSSLTGELWEIETEIGVGTARRLRFELRGIAVIYDTDREELSCLGNSASLPLIDGRIRLRLFVDRAAIDIFGQDGHLYMPVAVDLSANPQSLSLRAEGGRSVIHLLDVHELASIWSKRKNVMLRRT
jgi:sucrose-6-phosphate hydrolase SacC (GH32 family)